LDAEMAMITRPPSVIIDVLVRNGKTSTEYELDRRKYDSDRSL
jgi:hypothetical protein